MPRDNAPPPRMLVDYVVWKLGLSSDGFAAQLIHLFGHADADNLRRLRLAFPDYVAAWEAWQASPDGEFEVRPL